MTGENLGIDVNYLNTPFAMIAGAEQVGSDFRPATGFVLRDGRRYRASARYDWYPDSEWLQRVTLGTDNHFFTRINGDLETSRLSPQFGLRTLRGDQIQIQGGIQREVLFGDFAIQPGHVIPAGDCQFSGTSADLQTSATRPVWVALRARTGEFFRGDQLTVGSSVEWRPWRFFQAEAGAQFNDIDFPEPTGECETLVGFVGIRVTPNPRLSWNTLAQWDTVTDELGIQSRIRWIARPGQDIFLTLNHGLDIEDRRFANLATETVAKIGLRFRF